MLKPTPTPTRELVNLDGVWRFGIDTRLGEQPWTSPLTSPLEAAVPASYNDLFTDAEIRDHVGWVYYQREVRVPRGWADERILLRFDAATHAARVYVDDELVGEHVGGYTPFDVDITDRVQAGGAFRLTVAVSGELTNETIPPGKIEVGMTGKRTQTYFHDFYNYAGLARSVWLYSVPATRIDDVTVVTGFEGATGHVDYRVDVVGDADVRVRLADAAGAVVAEAHRCCGHALGGRRRAVEAGRGVPVPAHGRGRARRRGARLVPGRRRHPHRRGARPRVPHQRRAVLLHRLRQARRRGHPRQGPRRRLHGARLPADGVVGRELVPHVALSLRRRGARLRRPPRHRRHRRDGRGRPQHGRRGRDDRARRRSRPSRSSTRAPPRTPRTPSTCASSSGATRTTPPS